MKSSYKPTKADLEAAIGKTVPDILQPQLRILFCGINPSLYSAAVGHHFARPGNRFWPTLYAAGFTDRLLAPWEDRDLLNWGYGLTNIADRATARADQLETAALIEGKKNLAMKIKYYQPRCLAILGVSAYRTAFNRPQATLGPQPETLAETLLWVLPNPSGLNAHYQLRDLQQLYGALHQTIQP
jgi:TDG/mug DNA glycosylase family protein